ncbi:DNA-binding PucR family transcriptional regulator [Streptomyces sp. 3330]|uniref:PucR family transcriptional regulator n=1 Tax=Streptomyces sp. 3330 TaxID=2817755 RepID=UPI00285E75F1|nr:helix-turn-helix domain-containing protein [Streptomyces sp. 3330]MDR6979678.1 DNA-binding PucR family transcriptional regulator [Streptomyces sp. 3330]
MDHTSGVIARGDDGVQLRQILAALTVPVVVAGGDAVITDVVMTDVIVTEPGEHLGPSHGALVLAVGARGAATVPVFMAAARSGAAAVMVKVGADGLPARLREAAREADIAVLAVQEHARWDHLAQEVRAGLTRLGAWPATAPGTPGDLSSLAQTLATVTYGVVSIEDSAGHVLAYSRSGEEADELRRLTILGRACPEPYLKVLRDSGVFQRLRSGEEVVETAEQPDLGYRRRLAIGINAGHRPLGMIWVQEGDRPLCESSAETMRGAARLAAPQLVDHYYQGNASARLASRVDLAHGLLTGRFDAEALARHLGLDPAQGATVIGVDLREPRHPGSSAALDLRREESAGIISLHASAFRRDALVTQACGQIYVLLPARNGAADDTAIQRWATELVTVLRRQSGTPVQAALAGLAPRLEAVPTVKMRAYHALQLMARTPERAVATCTELQAALLLGDMLRLLDEHPDSRHAGLETLATHDAEQGSELARSLLAYLDGFGDVTRTAEALNVHPNTLRYRVRKAISLSGISIDDPDQRLVAMLQLRLALNGGPTAKAPFPAS